MSTVSVSKNQNLAAFNTMGIAARAKYFAVAQSTEDLQQILKHPDFIKSRHLILGGGSNLLFTEDYDGFIVHNQIKGREVINETSENILLKAGAGENWHELVMYCVENGWGGVENLSLIPGSVGAAPIQNIGAYGVELDEVFVELEAMDIETGSLRRFRKNECRFGYRDSIFKHELKGKFVITSVTLGLQRNHKVNTSYRALSDKLEEKNIFNPGVKEVSDAVIEIRQSKLPDPAQIGNSGSFFKNPIITKNEFLKLKEQFAEVPSYPSGSKVKIPAAWLIDQCGWKGKRIGDAGVHKMQALVLVNYGKATGEEIQALAEKIQHSVKERFGVELAPEVNVV